jgi:hypothetical protein
VASASEFSSLSGSWFVDTIAPAIGPPPTDEADRRANMDQRMPDRYRIDLHRRREI